MLESKNRERKKDQTMHSGLAARHASWVLNRFLPVKGATAYELVYGKSYYKGLLAEYGEPVHGYIKSLNKQKAR